MLPYKALLNQFLDNTLTDFSTYIFFEHIAYSIVFIKFFYLSQSTLFLNLKFYIYFLLLSLRLAEKISIFLFEGYIAHYHRCPLVRAL